MLSLGRFNPDLSSATPRILFLRKIFRALRVLLFYTPRRLENRRLVFRGRTSNPSIHPSSFHPYQSRDFHIFLMVTPATCHIDHPQRIIINSKSSGRRKRVYFPRSILFSFQTFLPVGSMRKDGPSVLLPRRPPARYPFSLQYKRKGGWKLSRGGPKPPLTHAARKQHRMPQFTTQPPYCCPYSGRNLPPFPCVHTYNW